MVSASEVTLKKFQIFLSTNDTATANDDGGLLSGSSSGDANYTDIKIINKYFGLMNSLFDFIYFIVFSECFKC